ncbi:MAG: methyltransferase [Christensenellaceae bacterium]|jgi:tRNA1(Val) A37 N6-methylase TrmN6|nr:methyltransferase [Christensenellaceae bacterium]
MLFDDERLDDLQCGGLKIIQNKTGYSFTMDSVLLANFLKARALDRVADLGSGSGIVSILASAKTRAREFVCIELQSALCDMSMRSIELNKLTDRIKVINADLKCISSVQVGIFDVVVSNPPYYVSNASSTGDERSKARTDVCATLNDVISDAQRILKYGGDFYLIIKADRVVDCLHFMRENRIEPKLIVPVQPTPQKCIDTLLIKGRHGGKPGLILKKPLLVFESDGSYSKELRDIYEKH